MLNLIVIQSRWNRMFKGNERTFAVIQKQGYAHGIYAYDRMFYEAKIRGEKLLRLDLSFEKYGINLKGLAYKTLSSLESSLVVVSSVPLSIQKESELNSLSIYVLAENKSEVKTQILKNSEKNSVFMKINQIEFDAYKNNINETLDNQIKSKKISSYENCRENLVSLIFEIKKMQAKAQEIKSNNSIQNPQEKIQFQKQEIYNAQAPKATLLFYKEKGVLCSVLASNIYVVEKSIDGGFSIVCKSSYDDGKTFLIHADTILNRKQVELSNIVLERKNKSFVFAHDGLDVVYTCPWIN